MATYKHKKTGALITLSSAFSSPDWELVAEKKQKKAPKKEVEPDGEDICNDE